MNPLDEIISRLRKENPVIDSYLKKKGAGSFFVSSSSMSARYEELIKDEALELPAPKRDALDGNIFLALPTLCRALRHAIRRLL